MIFGSK